MKWSIHWSYITHIGASFDKCTNDKHMTFASCFLQCVGYLYNDIKITCKTKITLKKITTITNGCFIIDQCKTYLIENVQLDVYN